MEEIITNNNRKIFIILNITIIGAILGLLIWCVTKESFLFIPTDRFMDYFNTLKVLDNIYSEVGIGRGYFPVTYVLLNIIKSIFGVSINGYFITIIIAICLLIYFFITMFKEEKNRILIVFYLIFFSYPILFTLDRGNIEYIVLEFLICFILAYKRRYYKTAAIILAFPIGMKLYPALFAILLLKDKRIKEFVICMIFSLILIILSFLIIGGNWTNLHVALENFSFFTDSYAKNLAGVQFSHTLWSGINFFSILLSNSLINSSYISTYTIAILLIALWLICYMIFIEREKWKLITILTIMMITFPHVSFDYTLIHMYIPIAYFITAKNTKKWEEIIYSILFGLAIIPMNWFQTTSIDNISLNIGLLIKPLILISIMLIIVVSTIRSKTLNKIEKKELCSED